MPRSRLAPWMFALVGGAGLAHADPPAPAHPASLPIDAPDTDAPDTEAPDALAPPVNLRPPANVAAPVHTFVAAFDRDLAVRTDLLLEGVDAETRIVVPIPDAWELAEDPVLELAFAHSAALLADRSHLTVALGNQTLATVRLGATNTVDGRLQVRLPRALLNPYNHLVIRAAQHYGPTCEDPFDPGLWTRVKNSSTVRLRYRARPVVPDLAQLPFPFVDPTGFGPATVSLVLPPAPSAATIEALGALGLALGRHADYRGVAVREVVPTVRDAGANAILVGLWRETPEIEALLGDVAPRATQGLIALVPNPADATRAVLVVTGTDVDGLARAVQAVASRHAALSGTQARVDYVVDGRPPPSRRDPRPAPDVPVFPFAALGLPDTTVRGFYTPGLRVPLVLDGNASLRPGGASALVRYSYAAGLDPRLSAMEVRLDGVAIKSVSLDDPAGETGATVRVALPDALVSPSSNLEIGFSLFPADYDACVYASDATLWATIHADSTLTLPRDGVADLPDLGLLRHGLWPFHLGKDGGVVAALPDRPGASDVGAGFQLAAALGRWSTADAPRFQLRAADGLDFAGLADSHVIVLSSGAPHALYDRLARTQALPISRGTTREVRAGGARAMALTVPDTDALVTEVLHPASPDRAALVLSASKAVPLSEVVTRVTSPEGLAALTGDVAILDTEDGVRTLALAERRRVGTLPVGVAVVLALRNNWGLVGVSLLAGAVVLALARRAWARAKEA